MNVLPSKILSTLVAVLLGAYVMTPAGAATPERQPGAQQPATQQPAAESPTKLIPGKTGDEVCARLDQSGDGYITAKDWKGANMDEKTFKSADANRDGRLDMKECAKVLGS